MPMANQGMNTDPFDFQSFQESGQIFLRELVADLMQIGLPADSFKSDHLCFRVRTMAEYDFYKQALAPHGRLLTEAMINGRAISTFHLVSPFRTGTHEVSLLELPAPKTGFPQPTGFEHAEFVIRECFTHFRAKFPNLDFIEAGGKTLNPELCLKLSKGRQAKFHHLSLDRVIDLEDAKIQDIVFDFDGTLIKSRENIYEINRIVFSRALNRDVSRQEAIEKFHPEFSKMFEAFAVTCPVKQIEAISSWGTISGQFSYELFEGVVEALSELRSHGFRLHLWTARDEASARKILFEHDLDGFFATLSFADHVQSKPHPGSLRFDWKRMGRNQVMVIGDSPSDMLGAGNIAAIRGGALWDPFAKKSSLIETGAELFFHQVADLTDWLMKKAHP